MGGKGSGRPLSPEGVVRRMSLSNRGSVISPEMIAPNYGGIRRGARKTSDDPFITQSEADLLYSKKYRIVIAAGMSTSTGSSGEKNLSIASVPPTNNIGLAMIRGSDLTGGSLCLYVSAVASGIGGVYPTVRLNIKKNGSIALNSAATTISSTGINTIIVTQAEGLDTYASTDVLTMSFTISLPFGSTMTIDSSIGSAEFVQSQL